MKLSILIIEDELDLVKVYSEFCKEHFDTIYSATTIMEAKNVLMSERVDAIFTDNRLPDGQGVDLIYSLNSRAIKIPTILITAYADKSMAIKATNCQIFQFLEKPSSYAQISKALSNLKTHLLDSYQKEKVFNCYLIKPHTLRYLKDVSRISKREMEVIELGVHPYDNNFIARQLFISAGTVKRHFENIFLKLGISSKHELRNLIQDLNRSIPHDRNSTQHNLALRELGE